jgi:hypothetical protein
MVETVTHPFKPTQFSTPQPFLAQLPLLAVGLSDAATLAQAHHIVEAIALKPAEETGPTKASIG